MDDIIVIQEATNEFELEITQIDTNIYSLDIVIIVGAGTSLTAQTLGDTIFGATEKTTPADTDMVALMDSEDLVNINIAKKFSWSSIKTALTTAFNSVFVAKVTGSSLVADTEIAKIHAPGSDNQDLSGYSLTSHNHSGTYEPANSNIQSHISSKASPHSNVTTLNDGATIDVNWSTGNVQAITLGGNRTFTFSNGVAGALYQLYIYQDASAPRTITLPNTVKTPGGVLPVLSATNGALDILTFSFNGTNYNLIGFATDVK